MKGLDGRLKHLRNYDGAKAKKRKADEHMVKLRNTKVSSLNPPPLEDISDEPGDMVTHQRNIVLLNKQYQKTAPNQYIINELMDKIFSVPRKRTLSNPTQVNELIQTYPCFKNPDQVCTVIIILYS